MSILDDYSDSITNITLLPQQLDTITFKAWIPETEGSYTGKWTTTSDTGVGGDHYYEQLYVTDGKGPEIFSISPETGTNGGDFTLTITGKGFKTGLKAVLFNDDYPTGRIAENTDIVYISSDSIEATFDLGNVPESSFHLTSAAMGRGCVKTNC